MNRWEPSQRDALCSYAIDHDRVLFRPSILCYLTYPQISATRKFDFFPRGSPENESRKWGRLVSPAKDCEKKKVPSTKMVLYTF